MFTETAPHRATVEATLTCALAYAKQAHQLSSHRVLFFIVIDFFVPSKDESSELKEVIFPFRNKHLNSKTEQDKPKKMYWGSRPEIYGGARRTMNIKQMLLSFP